MTKTTPTQEPFVQSLGRDVRLLILAKPKSSRSMVLGLRNGSLDVALTSAPVDGKANAELIEVLSKALRVPRSRVLVESGQSGRHKRVRVLDIEPAAVRAALGLDEA